MRSQGFTLLECLIALAIAAIALAAAGRATGLSAEVAGQVKLRVLAGVVAENRLSELAASRAWPAPGAYQGIEQQAGVAFAWRMQVSETPHPRFRRIEVLVTSADAPAQELRRLVAALPRES